MTTKHKVPPTGLGQAHGKGTVLGTPKPRFPFVPAPVSGPALVQGQIYQFIGSITRGGSFKGTGPANSADAPIVSFEVLAGLSAPTITAGYAKWSIVDRPQQVGMTVLQGYDPLVMDVPILFDNVMRSGVQPYTNTAETAIAALEWMAGRFGQTAHGVSPIVYINSVDGNGRNTKLIPLQAQGVPWVITNLAWDSDAIRDPFGWRIRQAATVTVTQHIGAPGDIDNPAQRADARRQLAVQYTHVTITKAHNTIQKIAGLVVKNPSAAGQILKDNKTRLKLPSSVNADLYPKHHGQTLKVRKSLYIR